MLGVFKLGNEKERKRKREKERESVKERKP